MHQGVQFLHHHKMLLKMLCTLPFMSAEQHVWMCMQKSFGGLLTAVVVITEGVDADGVQNGSALGSPPYALEEAGPLAADCDR